MMGPGVCWSLLHAVASLLATGDLDHILIESTGIGEPLPVAQTF
ncbi:GTP-binding protein [Deinococcus hohokamensis]|uniref:GTP-binding protein n=1 Tax=Deinococcus hohokamensis TaxID=309883 RepID=A0ABV9ID78_9DEIO